MSVTVITLHLMTVTDITKIVDMGRWEPDARGRLRVAALELFAERGYEQTTVADIAERGGVTERTFFRHFSDKREVLFEGSEALQEAVLASIASAPADLTPLEIMATAMEAASSLIAAQPVGYPRIRAAVVAANPSLQERELLKLANLGVAAAEALQRRGVPALAAQVAAQSGVTIFSTGFERWVTPGHTDDFASCIRAALDQLRVLTA